MMIDLPVTLGVALGAMVLLWLVSLWLRDASIVDPWWGPGFALLALVALARQPDAGARAWLLAGMATAWGLRLGVHLAKRNFGHGEDARYAEMREHHGERFWWISLFTVFLLQGVLQWFISLPLQLGQRSDAPLGWIDALGVLVWIIGLTFETVGDYQLARFKSDPDNKGQVMDEGLWRYTRHPNYFGDAVVWWGHYVVAAATPLGRWTILSPVLMTFLLRRVSGVTLLERSMGERPGYRDYVARTSPFVPWPPDDS